MSKTYQDGMQWAVEQGYMYWPENQSCVGCDHKLLILDVEGWKLQVMPSKCMVETCEHKGECVVCGPAGPEYRAYLEKNGYSWAALEPIMMLEKIWTHEGKPGVGCDTCYRESVPLKEFGASAHSDGWSLCQNCHDYGGAHWNQPHRYELEELENDDGGDGFLPF